MKTYELPWQARVALRTLGYVALGVGLGWVLSACCGLTQTCVRCSTPEYVTTDGPAIVLQCNGKDQLRQPCPGRIHQHLGGIWCDDHMVVQLPANATRGVK